MKLLSVRSALFVFSTTLAFLCISCGKTPAPQTEVNPQPPPKPAPSVPTIKVTPPVQAKAAAPKPGPTAKKKPVTDTFGKGKAAVALKGHPGGPAHSFWAEQLDVDGSGNPVLVDEAWDNHHKVLYISNDRTFGCGNGQSATGSTLMAVYGKGNTLKRAAGSGWWVTELDAGACGVQDAGLYGCHFDGTGANTDCGVATVQSEADDVVIVPLPNASGSSGGASAQPPASAPTAGSNSTAPPASSQQSPQ